MPRILTAVLAVPLYLPALLVVVAALLISRLTIRRIKSAAITECDRCGSVVLGTEAPGWFQAHPACEFCAAHPIGWHHN